jgi:hypothetical protein
MNPRPIFGIVALACTSVGGLSGAFMHFEKWDKVNEELQEKERFDWLGWYLFKYQRLNRDSERLYRTGHSGFELESLQCSCLFVWPSLHGASDFLQNDG